MGTYLVMKNNFIRGMHHKVLFAVTFLLPVILCFAIGMVHFDKVSIRVGILTKNEAGARVQEIQKVRNILKQSGIAYANANLEGLHTDLISGKYHYILDYRGSKRIDDFTLITYQKKEKSTFIENEMKQAFINDEPIMLEGMKQKGMSVSERDIAILLTIFLIFSTKYASGFIGDRDNKTLQRYQFAVRGSSGYILGYILYDFIIMIGQGLLCLAVLSMVQKEFQLGFANSIIIAILIAGISTIFGLLISLLSKSEFQANIIGASLASVMSLLGGTFIAVSAMPGLLRIFSLASPVRWMVEFLRLI